MERAPSTMAGAIGVRRGLHENQPASSATLRVWGALPIFHPAIDREDGLIVPCCLAGLGCEEIPIVLMSARPTHPIDRVAGGDPRRSSRTPVHTSENRSGTRRTLLRRRPQPARNGSTSRSRPRHIEQNHRLAPLHFRGHRKSPPQKHHAEAGRLRPHPRRKHRRNPRFLHVVKGYSALKRETRFSQQA
jgi:hypothetical protein